MHSVSVSDSGGKFFEICDIIGSLNLNAMINKAYKPVNVLKGEISIFMACCGFDSFPNKLMHRVALYKVW